MFNLKKEKSKIEIELVVDNKEWEEGVQKVYESSKSKFNIVGFRKGHAPRKVIEKQFGEGVFFEDTIEYFVNKTINEVLMQNPELEPVAMPTTQFESYTVDAGLKMKIFFEIVPDFELCNYKGQKIKVHDSKVSDHEVEHAISHLLEDNAKFETVEREIKNGDSAVIDFTGYIGDVAFDGGHAENYPLAIGSHSFIDTFEDQLVGHKTGDNVDVKVTFPENYGAEDLQGKEAVFKVVVKEVREKTLPELNDKFIADATEFETVEEYRKHLVAHIQNRKNSDQQAEFDYNMREYLVQNTNVEIPEVMVENYIHEDMHRMEEALSAYGMKVEDYLAQTGTNMEDYLKNAKERVLKSTKLRYIFRKIIEENKIAVDADELKENTKGITDENEIIRRENELLLRNLYQFLRENNEMEVVEDK